TATVRLAPTIGLPSIGDLSSTAIFATQTQLAQPPTPLPTATNTPTTAPGITPTIAPTATITNTPTVTPTPKLAELFIASVTTPNNTIILNPAQQLSTAPFTVEIGNQGSAPAPVFVTTISLADGTSFSAPTSVILDPGTKTTVTVNVNFTK